MPQYSPPSVNVKERNTGYIIARTRIIKNKVKWNKQKLILVGRLLNVTLRELILKTVFRLVAGLGYVFGSLHWNVS